jgi:hypothetical protein
VPFFTAARLKRKAGALTGTVIRLNLNVVVLAIPGLKNETWGTQSFCDDQFWPPAGRRRGVEGDVSEKSLQNGANHGLWVLAKALPGASGSLALKRMQKRSSSGNWRYTVVDGKAKWKSRLSSHFEERYEIVNCTWSGFHFVVSLCCFF